jgi:16S rRNA (adenine1518-N6/adenine1519-N6)-dimethyltransferase
LRHSPLATPSERLHALGLRPKKSWGQNFLSDDSALSAIADATLAREGDVVVELGPGLGHLTWHLSATGAKVVAIERDRDMVKAMEALALPGVTVVEGNAATMNFAKAALVAVNGETAQAPQVIVAGNLPYHLTSPILFSVLEQVATVRRAVFTVQAEVADRLAAAPGGRDYGLLTVLLSLRFFVEEAQRLPRELFHPAPNVDSAVLTLERLEKPRAEVTDEARFKRVVKASFAQRRKTISNSLKSDKTLWLNESAESALERAGIDPRRRAETLSVEEFAALERAVR